KVAVGTVMPWREAGSFGPGLQFTTEGRKHGPEEEDPRAQFRAISPGFFASLGVPIVAGRDFNDSDRKSGEQVVIISQSLAQRMFPNQEAVNRHLQWTDPVIKFIPGFSDAPRRIVGVTADLDDEHVIPGPILTVYHPFEQLLFGGRMFVHTSGNPYGLVAPITRLIHDMSTDQPVEHVMTLTDVRAEVLSSDRLNSIVFGGFALVALAIAVVGVAGVLAFSVSARTREFGIRLAIGSQPRSLLTGVIGQGVLMAGLGIVAGAVFGYGITRVASRYFHDLQAPSALPVVISAIVLLIAAIVASALPAVRAAKIDVMQALRTD
ncbi:MAG: FtsX-like permease family protein, partial [Candidatus Acidiferrum sp.]